MRMIRVLVKREIAGYFATPVAYVFICIFLAVTGWFAFFPGRFYEMGQASLQSFFGFHPWLYLFLVPAVSMRLWAEERRVGTIELLMTLPVTMPQAVMGKFIAAWLFTGIALLMTFPIVITVNYLGSPDNGVIAASYIGSFLMSGAFLAIGAAVSAVTKNQVIAFVVTAAVCLIFVLFGFPGLLNALSSFTPESIVEALRSFSFIEHFDGITKGMIDVRDVVFFGSLIAFFLFVNSAVLEVKKAD